MRILFLSRWLPYPPDNGSKLRIFNLIKQLARCHEVSLVTFHEREDVAHRAALRGLAEYCAQLRLVPYRAYRPSSRKAIAGLFTSWPRSLVDAHSDAMDAAVAAEFAGQKSELVVASELDMAPYAWRLRDVPAVLEDLELSTFTDGVRSARPLHHRVRPTLTWLKLRAFLRRLLPRFAACTVVSELERANVGWAVPSYSNVRVIPNAVDLAAYDGQLGPARPSTLVFSGALTYRANYDAARHFLESIYPLVVRDVPDVSLRLTGSTTGIDLAPLRLGPHVVHSGYVADIRPVVARSWASVVPLRIGGGTRLKVLESMALGTPVVSTRKGAEGLDVTGGENILLADDPAAFAGSLIELLRSPEMRSRLAASGRRLVESRYSWHTIGRDFCALVERAAAGQPV